MSAENPTPQPEKKEGVEDNARKFTLTSLDSEFLREHDATSFELTIDWIVTDEKSKQKLAYKKLDTGEVQILLISKVTENGNRIAKREKIDEAKYQELLASAVLHLEKKRYEFKLAQNNTTFSAKYDEFAESKLRLLEIDATTDEEREKFDPTEFPASLQEVTGDMNYYGYRITEII